MENINALLEKVGLNWNINNCRIEKYKIIKTEHQDHYFQEDTSLEEIEEVLKGEIDKLVRVVSGWYIHEDYSIYHTEGKVIIHKYDVTPEKFHKDMYIIHTDEKINLEDLLEDAFKEFCILHDKFEEVE